MWCLLAMLVSTASAQDDAVDGQIWVDYHEHAYFKPNWEFYGDGGIRTVTQSWEWQEFYARPSVRYHHARWPVEFRGGAGLFYTHNDTESNELEFRPWLGTLVKWPRFRGRAITNYFRLEGRFDWTTDDWELDKTLRFRYQIGTRFSLKQHVVEKYYYVPVGVEWFANVGATVEDLYSERMRYILGLGYVFSYIWVGEVYAILQTDRVDSDTNYSPADFIIRFQIKRLWSAVDYMDRES